MRVLRLPGLRLRSIHVALLLALAVYVSAGVVWARGEPMLSAQKALEKPMPLPPPPKGMKTPGLIELWARESRASRQHAERNSRPNPAQTWYFPLVFAPF